MQYVISMVAGIGLDPILHVRWLVEVYEEVTELLCTAGPNAK